MSFFSVIIPTYNRLELLTETLASVERQTFTDYELIVVDDGSTDGTVHAFAHHPRIKLLRQQNCGPGAARNLGIRHAKGEYVAFLDSDDLWFDWTLRTYREVIENNDRPAIVVGKPWVFESQFQHPQPMENGVNIHVAQFLDYLASGTEWRWWGVSSFVVRTDVLRCCGGFVSEWINGEDADLMMRIGTATGFVQITDPETFAYRHQPVSAMSNLERTLSGVRELIASEKRGLYPGGMERAHERRRIITRHVRPVSLDLLAHGQLGAACKLYLSTFSWHTRERRWRYLFGYTALAFKQAIRRWILRSKMESN